MCECVQILFPSTLKHSVLHSSSVYVKRVGIKHVDVRHAHTLWKLKGLCQAKILDGAYQMIEFTQIIAVTVYQDVIHFELWHV